MENFWLFLTIFLDVFPWIFLQYLPFRGKTVFSYPVTMALASSVMITWQVGFVALTVWTGNNLSLMFAYRLSQLLMLILLNIFLIRDNGYKRAFIYCLGFPAMMTILTLSSYLMRFVPIEGAPDYMIPALLRLGIIIVALPFVAHWWTKRFIPAIDARDVSIWKYAWPIPATFTLISLFYTKGNFGLVSVGLYEVLGRLAVFLGEISACVMLLKTLAQEEIRIRATEQAEKGQMLLALQAEQYQALAESIEETRTARHDLKQHLSVISALANQGELAQLQGYVARFVPQTQTSTMLHFCENLTVNAIVADCDRRSNEQNIRTDFLMDIPSDFRIRDTDLCIVLGNLLDNAREACAAVPQEARYIRARARNVENRLYLMVENSCAEHPRKEHGAYLSRKRGYRIAGTGLSSVEVIVHKYYGELTVETTEKTFRVSTTMEGVKEGKMAI